MPSGALPKIYPAEMVAQVKSLYSDGGLSQDEVAVELGVSQKVIWNLMRRHNILRRPQIKRDQKGDRNATWKGVDAGYTAFHARLYKARGKATRCEECGATAGRMFEWANLTGDYANLNDYKQMCRSCHRKLDHHRRSEQGRNTTPAEMRR